MFHSDKLGWLFSVVVLLATAKSQAADISADEIPPHAISAVETSGWTKALREALPAEYFTNGPVDFQTATNLLRQESDRGNQLAEALWGLTLLTQNLSSKQGEMGLQILRSAGELGCVQAMLDLGTFYEQGKFVRRNYNEAFHWYQMAAGKGSAEGQLQLGGCYHYGLGVTPDLKLAAEKYLLAAEQTNYVAMKSFGYFLSTGLGVTQDVATAKYWFTRAAQEGQNRRAMFDLALIYSQSQKDTNASIEAFRWYKKSAELGDDLAAEELAKCYLRGSGVSTNISSYHYWMLKSAFLGCTEAQFFVGQAYRTGDGLPIDPQNSVIWYRKAADKNDPRACYDLALHYLAESTNPDSLLLAQGYMLRAAQMGHREAQFQMALNLFKNANDTGGFAQAQSWLSTAGENGWGRAEFVLFQLYFNGVAPTSNCPAYAENKTEAIKWLRQAADHGNPQAQSILAVMLIRGAGVESDNAQAEKLLREAAGHGYTQAQNDLGYAILNGDIISSDPLEAAVWLRLAAANATDPNVLGRAKYNLAKALAGMTEDQKSNAEERADDWHPIPVQPVDPMMQGWEKNPAYQREDGRFGH